jgi:hypothetical protein
MPEAMKKRLLPLLRTLPLWALFLPGIAPGQGTTFSISLTQLSGYTVCPDTVYAGQVATIQAVITNLGPDTIGPADSAVILTWMNQNTQLPVFLEDIGTLPINTTYSQGDTLVLTTTVTYDSMRYASGGNIVVVWPRMASGTGVTVDSMTFSICYDTSLTLSVPADPAGQGIVLAPNPVDREFYLGVPPDYAIEYVRIYNTAGQRCLDGIRAGTVDVHALPPGLYVVELKPENGVPWRRKLLKR